MNGTAFFRISRPAVLIAALSLAVVGCQTVAEKTNLHTPGTVEAVNELMVPATYAQYLSDRYAKPKVFALSPDGMWGFESNSNSLELAQIMALFKCRKNLLPGNLDCVVYDVDGARIVKFPIEVMAISERYPQEIADPVHISEISLEGKMREAYDNYKTMSGHKAFALGFPSSGAFVKNRSSADDAARVALKKCAQDFEKPGRFRCVVYDIDGEIQLVNGFDLDPIY